MNKTQSSGGQNKSNDTQAAQYIDKVADRLKQMDREFQDLKTKAQRKMSEDLPQKIEESFNQVEKKRDHLAAQLTSARRASSNAWSDIKIGLDAASSDLQTAFKSASERIKEAA